ncbi:MAG: hypothetical protein ACRCYX_10375 [Dermatophilaceae bacterium]
MSSRDLLREGGIGRLVIHEDDGRHSSSAPTGSGRMTGAHLRGTTSLAARRWTTTLAPGRHVTLDVRV